MAEISAIAGVGLIATIVGAVASAFGIKKVVDSEVNTHIESKVKPVIKEVAEMKKDVKLLLSKDEHKLICTLTSANVDQKFIGLRDHMDGKFAELAKCIDRSAGK